MAEINTVPIFEGWNVWAVWQKKDLDFELDGLGLSRDRRLRNWVHDVAGMSASGIDLEGSDVEILSGSPDLPVSHRKEEVAGPAMTLKGDAERRYVRFFNRGQQRSKPWPHDANYVLDFMYDPRNSSDPVVQGPAPETTLGGVAEAVGEGAASVLAPVFKPTGIWLIAGAAAVVAVAVVVGKASR